MKQNTGWQNVQNSGHLGHHNTNRTVAGAFATGCGKIHVRSNNRRTKGQPMKNIEFDINEIMWQTPEKYVGHEVNQYTETYVATFCDKGNTYNLFTIADPDNEYRNLVVVDNNGTIIKKLK